mgnify:FL=1
MSYQQTEKPKGFLYHYTTRDHLEDILRDGRIRRMGDKECWFCTSLEDTLELMQKTVMMEGKPYYGVGGVLRYYPVFVPESYDICLCDKNHGTDDSQVHAVQIGKGREGVEPSLIEQ